MTSLFRQVMHLSNALSYSPKLWKLSYIVRIRHSGQFVMESDFKNYVHVMPDQSGNSHLRNETCFCSVIKEDCARSPSIKLQLFHYSRVLLSWWRLGIFSSFHHVKYLLNIPFDCRHSSGVIPAAWCFLFSEDKLITSPEAFLEPLDHISDYNEMSCEAERTIMCWIMSAV